MCFVLFMLFLRNYPENCHLYLFSAKHSYKLFFLHLVYIICRQYSLSLGAQKPCDGLCSTSIHPCWWCGYYFSLFSTVYNYASTSMVTYSFFSFPSLLISPHSTTFNFFFFLSSFVAFLAIHWNEERSQDFFNFILCTYNNRICLMKWKCCGVFFRNVSFLWAFFL